MKTLFVENSFLEPLKIEISDDELWDSRQAQRLLKQLPWKGNFYIPCKSTPIGNNPYACGVDILVGNDSVIVVTYGMDGFDFLLDPGDDLFTIPDVYLNKSFEYKLSEHVFSLNASEVDLVNVWLCDKRKNDENIEDF